MERGLALDISSKTGFAFFTCTDKEFTLVDYGRLEKTTEPSDKYPDSYVIWAYTVFSQILELIEKFAPDILIIEETSGGSKSAYTQKILEFIHFLTARFIKDSKIKSIYYQTETWRRIIGCKMNLAEKENNKNLKKSKKENPDIKVHKGANGKRMGKIGRKHVNVRRINELLGDRLKEPLILAQEDVADGLGLMLAYLMEKKCLTI